MALSSQTAHDREALVFVLSKRHTLSHLEVPAGAALRFGQLQTHLIMECTVCEQMLFVEFICLFTFFCYSNTNIPSTFPGLF